MNEPNQRVKRVGCWPATAICVALSLDCTPSAEVANHNSANTNPSAQDGSASMVITIQSTGFANNATIPTRYTGDGADVSPPLSWSDIPASAKELALICDDPDAPSTEPWVHWVIYKIAPTTTSLSEGVQAAESPSAPAGAAQGRNSWGTIGYRGPAPPRGQGVHHYHFKLYALDAPLNVSPGLDKTQLLAAMRGHIVAQGELIGTYQR